MTTVAIHGAGGRMGQRLVALAIESESLSLGAAIEAPTHPLIGQDAGQIAGSGACGINLTSELPDGIDVVIDFSAPVATRKLLPICIGRKIPLVIGTTGLEADDLAQIAEAAHSIAMLQAPNMALGVNLLFALAGQVAKQLGDDYDIEIVETHHRYKVDAPSGTALGIAQSICSATGRDIEGDVVHGRHGKDCERKPREIGMHALRSGDVVGRHTVSFGALGEELALVHTATSRDVFVRGALHAAEWLSTQGPGRYTMADVLGLGA